MEVRAAGLRRVGAWALGDVSSFDLLEAPSISLHHLSIIQFLTTTLPPHLRLPLHHSHLASRS